MNTIEIVVSPTGEARIETRGYAGFACQDATRLLEAALGVKQSEQLTAAYFQHQTAVEGRVSARGSTGQS